MIQDGYEKSNTKSSSGDIFLDPCSVKYSFSDSKSLNYRIDYTELLNLSKFCKEIFKNKDIVSEFKLYNNISHPNLITPNSIVKSYFSVKLTEEDID